jgi:glycosyltransferase involved in cell wall biosynthesis
MRRISYRFLDAVVVLTSEAKQWVRTHTAARAVYVIPNPLAWPLENGEPRLLPEETCLPGRSIILAVGRFVPQKGFARLIEAFNRLKAENPSWDLVILGAGPDRQMLESRRDKLGLNGRVFFPGRAGNVGDWYKRSSIFAMTSLFEGFPNALLEAMGYGLSVISTDCDTGPRDLIENGVNGFLVTEGDQDALTTGLQQLMASSDLRARLSAKARNVVEDYALDNIWLRWHSVFDAIAVGSR